LCPFNGDLVFTPENNSTAADTSSGFYPSSHNSAFPQRSEHEQLSAAALLAGRIRAKTKSISIVLTA
jgi:hypothetical protein